MPATAVPTRTSATFPLRDDQIPSVQLSDAQAKEYRQLAQEIVAKTLFHETKFRYHDNETLDDKDWKFVRAKERMRVYKRTATAAAFSPTSTVRNTESLSPMVLAVGFMEGKLEDVLYGVYHTTTAEMRSVTSFLNKNHLDAAVLANIDLSTAEDPFRYLGVKWRVIQTPGVGTLIRKRDVCTLEHLGIDVDENGNEYGFHLMKSVDLPDLPKFSDENVVRAQVMLCCIYRQITPTVVGVYTKAIFDLNGDMMNFFSYLTAAELVLGISKALECAAAKRLTLLALQKNIQTSELLRSSSRYANGVDADGNKIAAADEKDTCTVCLKKRFFLAPQNRTCRICSSAACAKCYVKTAVFAKPQNVQIVCCKACVIESRELMVDPGKPHPEVGAEAYLT